MNPTTAAPQAHPNARLEDAVAERFRPFGATIFAEMSALAAKHDAVNLGQGFPNFPAPTFIKDAAIEAIRDGRFDQYARMTGAPALSNAVSRRYRDRGLEFDPDREITVTCGCTEAIPATILGLVNPGDEVVLIAPFYDSYPASVAMAGGVARYVTLKAPEFRLTREDLEAACSARTRLILVNTPHNPTGRVFDRSELELVADVARRHDALVVSDEVYEDLLFEGEHISMASLPGMAERTVTLSSLGKTFSCTGWKIGWVAAPEHLSRGVRAAHQFLTFAVATPFQEAAAIALAEGEGYVRDLRDRYHRSRDRICAGLERLGFGVHVPQGTYFVLADHSAFGFENDRAFCMHLAEHARVAAIPPSVFYSRPEDGHALVRFAFCKTDETIDEALARMASLSVA